MTSPTGIDVERAVRRGVRRTKLQLGLLWLAVLVVVAIPVQRVAQIDEVDDERMATVDYDDLENPRRPVIDDDDSPPETDPVEDADKDGTPDDIDRCPGQDDLADADGDGTPDGCDDDADDDGTSNDADRCPGFDDRSDADRDGIPDGCDAAIAFPFGLQPGQTKVLAGLSLAATPELSGNVLHNETRSFEITLGDTVLVRGQVVERVVRSSSTGRLVFSSRLEGLEDSGDGWAIEQLVVSGFGGTATDVEYNDDEAGAAPATATRSTGGSDITLAFEPPLVPPPRSTAFVFLTTFAEEFDATGTLTIVARNANGNAVDTTVTVAIPLPPGSDGSS